jgi:hypothetical protein
MGLIAIIMLLGLDGLAQARWVRPYVHRETVDGYGKLSKPKRIVANYFCDGCFNAYDNSIARFHLSVASVSSSGEGNKSRIEFEKFPIYRVFHRVISIDHSKRSKVVMVVEHFHVQRPGREFWPYAMDAALVELKKDYKGVPVSELLKIAASRKSFDNVQEAEQGWLINLQAFVAEEVLRSIDNCALIRPALLAALESSDSGAAAEAARLLVKFKSDKTEEKLLAALSYDNAEVRRAAAATLAAFGRKYGFDRIRNAFRKEADIARFWVPRPDADLAAYEALALALARTGGGKALEDLAAVLSNPVPVMTLTHRKVVDYTLGYRRYAAIDVLEEIHHRDVLGVLVDQLNSSQVCGFINTQPIVDQVRTIEILKKLTGKNFGYIADPVVERLESMRAILQWRAWLQEDGERLMWDEKKNLFVIDTALPRREADAKLKAEIEKYNKRIEERRKPAEPTMPR